MAETPMLFCRSCQLPSAAKVRTRWQGCEAKRSCKSRIEKINVGADIFAFCFDGGVVCCGRKCGVWLMIKAVLFGPIYKCVVKESSNGLEVRETCS